MLIMHTNLPTVICNRRALDRFFCHVMFGPRYADANKRLFVSNVSYPSRKASNKDDNLISECVKYLAKKPTTNKLGNQRCPV